jgi:hypothetical protein
VTQYDATPKEQERMTSLATVGLTAAAAALGGVLAGGSLDRALVQLPAWRRVGSRLWATYSREADLRRGVVLYPIPGIGAPILVVAAALAYALNTGAPRSAAIPFAVAVALSVGHVIATSRAAPNMLRLRAVGDDQEAVDRSFSGFARWHALRAALQALAFAATLWALVAVLAP